MNENQTVVEMNIIEALKKADENGKDYAGVPSVSRTLAKEVYRLREELVRLTKQELKLIPMGDLRDGYFDNEEFYIDVEKDDKGHYSIYFRDKRTDRDAWLDQSEEVRIKNLEKELASVTENWNYCQDYVKELKAELDKKKKEETHKEQFSAAWKIMQETKNPYDNPAEAHIWDMAVASMMNAIDPRKLT